MNTNELDETAVEAAGRDFERMLNAMLGEFPYSYSHNLTRREYVVMAFDTTWDVFPCDASWSRRGGFVGQGWPGFWADLMAHAVQHKQRDEASVLVTAETSARITAEAAMAERFDGLAARIDTLERSVSALTTATVTARHGFTVGDDGRIVSRNLNVSGDPLPCVVKLTRKGALSYAKQLLGWCNDNGYEGIGGSIAVLVKELENDRD